VREKGLACDVACSGLRGRSRDCKDTCDPRMHSCLTEPVTGLALIQSRPWSLLRCCTSRSICSVGSGCSSCPSPSSGCSAAHRGTADQGRAGQGDIKAARQAAGEGQKSVCSSVDAAGRGRAGGRAGRPAPRECTVGAVQQGAGTFLPDSTAGLAACVPCLPGCLGARRQAEAVDLPHTSSHPPSHQAGQPATRPVSQPPSLQ